jgi:hypothetical protein
MSDKYTGYVDEMLVKGTWWAFNGGPKPRNFTGNIDNDPESIRNLSLIITGASQSNGHFPNDSYGKKYAVLTIRYGESDNRLYIQKVIDIDSKIEYERYYQGTAWGTYARVTSYSDSNQTAQKAYDQSLTNAGAIGRINQAIGRNDNQAPGTPIYTRLNNVETNIYGTNGINSKITSLQNGASNDNYARTSVQNLQTKAGKLLNQNDNKIINVYQGNAIIDIPGSGDSSPFPYWNNTAANAQWARDHGCTAYNSVMYIANTNADGVNGHEIHLEGAQFRGDLGWILTYDRSTLTSRTDGVYGLLCTWILFVIGGNWN